MSAGILKVAQCWDDGVDDDIRVIDVFRRHGAKASFNLNPACHTGQRTSAWKFRDIKPVYKLARPELVSVYEGFTIANHTASHPFLTRIPVEQACREIRDGRDALEQIFGRPVTGFAYPFGDHNAAVEDLVRECGHVYARTTQSTHHVLPCENPMQVAPSCHFQAPDFWERYAMAKAGSGLFYFWGHSYELMSPADWQSFDAMISRISSDPEAEWVDLPTVFAP